MHELLVLMGVSTISFGRLAGRRLLKTVLCLVLGVLAVQARAQDCRTAFDLGSSGVRAAASQSEGAPMLWRDLDLLSPLMEGRPFDALLPEVSAALRDLSQRVNASQTCLQLGGGFSAWRLAWRQDGAAMAQQLEALRTQTGVAVLVIPSDVEGRYGHASAQQALGPRLKTSHILDIGGGSMQVAGQDRSFGIELGQKSWFRLLCQRLERLAASCQLQPLQDGELQRVRALADELLRPLSVELGTAQLTAISRPVTRGIQEAMRSLGLAEPDSISLPKLSQAIEQLGGRQVSDRAHPPSHSTSLFAGYLVSDMLLVEAVMRAMNLATLALAETPINNLPALLRDERAFEWAKRHSCYLQRLRESGPRAYFLEPSDCDRP